MKLSVAIITLNEERNLKITLPTIKNLADEIIIVDSGSIDGTQMVAEDFGAKFIFNRWEGYGNQKNFAVNCCKNEWILLVDADEPISAELFFKINEVINSGSKEKVFAIHRRGFCFGKELKYGMFFRDYQVRLFRKGSGFFNDNAVHEQFITENKINKFAKKYFILHHSYDTMEDYLERFNKYTTQGAIDCKIKNFKGILIFSIILQTNVGIKQYRFLWHNSL
jgi:glycosyltransferase involved in cell wall biosynthesis